jgi:hypothetical protein
VVGELIKRVVMMMPLDSSTLVVFASRRGVDGYDGVASRLCFVPKSSTGCCYLPVCLFESLYISPLKNPSIA